MSAVTDFPTAAHFTEAPWGAPLDVEACVAAMPESATISGMFLLALQRQAEREGYALPSARDRYVPFRFYPLREHAALLVETCERRFPRLSLRQGLRKLGRGAPGALLTSTLGKVVLGAAEGVPETVRAMADAYPLNAKPSRVTIREQGPGRIVVRLEDIHYFLDCHHVGTFEGVLRHAGVDGTVRLHMHAPAVADMLLTW
jgi:hypothetical protein